MMLKQFLDYNFLGNRMQNYLVSLLLFAAAYFSIRILRGLILGRLKKWADKTSATLDDFIVKLIQSIGLPLAYLAALYLALNTLHLSSLFRKALDVCATAALAFFAARLISEVAAHGFSVYWISRGKDIALQRSLNGILKMLKTLIWSLAAIFFLDNLGFKISAVIAGLGIGGVAVALAAQAVLGDLFSYFAILFDRPFEIGDFIITGECLGTVEHIGIKTTRIRSLSGEQLIFSNTDLTNSRVRNYKRMEKRRVLFNLGVTYQTPLEKLKVIPGLIERIIKQSNDTAFDRAHFFSYGDSSLNYEIVYYVIGSDYNKYMDIQQEINFAIKEEFEKLNIEFAYPTRTLYLSREQG